MILKDKVAIVTGASLGIGRGIAIALASEGAYIGVNYHRSESSAREVFSKVTNMGRKAILVKGDVALEEDVRKIVSETLKEFGRIDILVNNAGLRTSALLGMENCPVLEMQVKDWDRMIAVNLRGPFLMSKAVLPQMMKQENGSIINISSGAGQKGVPGKSAYTSSKHGLEGFTKALAGEVKNLNVRVNTLAPGGRVDIGEGRGGLPLGVIIPACIFLASDKSQGVTGESIVATNWNKEKGITVQIL